MATKPKIYIKPSKRGSLRKAMGAKKGDKLSVSAMKSRLKNASPAMKKKLQFAINARKWKHELGGELPMYWDGDFLASTDNLNIGQSFAKMNNLPQKNLLPSGLAGTNNPGGGGIGLSFDPFSMGLKALTAIGGAIAAPMAMKKAEMYEDAEENMRQVDVGRATKGSGFQAFLQNPLSFGIGGRKRAKLEAEEFNENMTKQQRNRDIANRFSTMSESPTYSPVARQGGFIAYKGETHEGPNSGILVDKMGNPTGVSEGESVGLVEGGGKNKKGEVSYYEPESGSTYIYSDALGFGRPANSLLNKYKLNKPDSLQYQQYKNDLLTRTMVDKKFANLRVANEFAKETNSSAKDSLAIFKKGGELSSAKAKEMLRDGTAHGKKLTAEQKRYFGWIAGGRKEEGGELDKRTVLLPKENLQYDRDLSMNRGWMDSLKKAKNLDEMYSTPVGTWQGNPMTMKQFTEMPSYATEYYNPNYAIEFNKNRLGLPNSFQDINLKPSQRGESYTPAANFKPQNRVAYYKDGGYMKKRKKGPILPYTPEVEAPMGAYEYSAVPMYQNSGELGNPDEYYLQDKAKRMVYPGIIGSINPDPFISNESLARIAAWKKARASYKPTTPLQDMANNFNVYWGEPSPVLFNRTDAQYKNQQKIQSPVNIPQEESIKPTIDKPKIGTGKSLGSLPNPIEPYSAPDDLMNIQPQLGSLVSEPGVANMNLPSTPVVAGQGTNPFGEQASNPWLNPAGHILSAAGSLADYYAMKKAKPEDVSFGRVGAERISLANQRLANRRNAADARAINTTLSRNLGLNAGSAMANTAVANTGVNRLLGQQNAELLQNEEVTNAQMQQQANMMNAQLAAEESAINTQQRNAYRAMMAQRNPLGNIARTAASYFADNAGYQRGFDTLQMLAPNAELYRDPNAKWKRNPFARPNVRFRLKG